MKLKLLLLGVILTLGFLIRIYKITSSPESLYIDETSIGYNAWSIVETGRDEHGRLFPLFFEAFGEWKLPVYIYSVAFFQLFLGPTDLSVRLPAVIYGILTIAAIYFLVTELIFAETSIIKKFAPFVAALLLAVSPWHFQFTHAGFEVSSALFFLVLAVDLFFLAVRKKQFKLLLFSTVCFTLTIYAYNSARIVVPVLVLLLFVFYIKRFSIQTWLLTIGFGFLLLWPFIQFATSFAGQVRARQVGIFYQSYIDDPWRELIKNYRKNVSFETLFIRGEPTIDSGTAHRFPLLHGFELPIIIIGLIRLLLLRKRWAYFLLIWVIFGFVPPSLTTLNPHSLRALLVLPSLVIISALGFSFILTIIPKNYMKWFLGLVFLVLLSISTLGYLAIYHFKYTLDAGWDWQVDIARASQKILEIQARYGGVYIENPGAGRIAFLWYLKVSPQFYQQVKDKNALGFYYFPENLDNLPVVNKHNLLVSKIPLQYGILKAEIYYPNGQQAYYLWEQ